MNKKHIDRQRPFKEKAECSICGAKIEVVDEKMQLHLLTRHPLEVLQHPAVGSRIAQAAFELGSKLAGVISGK